MVDGDEDEPSHFFEFSVGDPAPEQFFGNIDGCVLITRGGIGVDRVMTPIGDAFEPLRTQLRQCIQSKPKVPDPVISAMWFMPTLQQPAPNHIGQVVTRNLDVLRQHRALEFTHHVFTTQ